MQQTNNALFLFHKTTFMNQVFYVFINFIVVMQPPTSHHNPTIFFKTILYASKKNYTSNMLFIKNKSNNK